VSLVDWLTEPEEKLAASYDRLYVPRNDGRYLRRNALVAAGNSGDPALGPLVESHAESDDELVREHARWAAARLAAGADAADRDA
jgi:epoxyqueuosine reductase